MRTLLKKALLKYAPRSAWGKLRYYSYYPELEEMNKANGKFLSTRAELYKYINDTFYENTPINFLEFGVYQGDSLRQWVEINNHQDSRFYGFDTFTGLPEDWEDYDGKVRMSKGTFTTNGNKPEITDQRVELIQGLFQHTLDDFLRRFEGDKALVIHNDSDLYSSTLFVLTKLDRYIHRQTIIIFDEYANLLHEMRALKDYAASYLREYDVIGYTRAYEQVAVMIK
jgi:hypothetical protein